MPTRLPRTIFRSLAAACIAASSLAAAQAADIKIGALFPFSGGLALLGDESYRGVQLAVDERNAAGGINGEKVVLVKADAVDANQAVGEARRLTSVENVSAVFGSYSSAVSSAATQVTELAGVPFFELGATADTITSRGFKYLYRSNSTTKTFADGTLEALTKVVAPQLKVDPKTLKIAIIAEDGPYGTLVSGFQKEGAKKLGLNVVQVLPYSAKSVDLSSLILRLKGADVDVVLQTSYQNDSILFFRQAAQAGFKPKAVIGAGGGYSLADTAKAVGAQMNGVYDIDFPQVAMNEKGAPGLDTFTAEYQKHFGMAPRSGHSLVNYVGAKAFLDVLANAKSTDKDKIRAAVLAYKKAAGTTAAGWGFQFADNGQNQLATTNVMQWQGGKLVTVYPEAVAIAKPVTAQ
ncbi:MULTISPECIES: ABC transporter substrate-binding protein [unclassified Caballeronia]|jgi:branched-chain amino acid transport system substrate-binding protein|uniref:ABC transporter substrate-binding protein n=1 Tax=unclassified Caballeronia TaxID=2646786 RepID=UPI002027D7EE|nr:MULTISPECIES: ABC transporter substrate-binding protein [unclassified Caballeronia]